MSLEFSKLSASVLVAGLIAIGVGKVSATVYHAGEMPEKRGFSIAVADAVAADAPAEASAPAVDMTALLAKADPKMGEGLTKACKACHDFAQGGANKVGPALWGVYGKKIGTHEGYKYSADLAAKSSESWDEKSLNAFLEKPKGFAKGTKMSFPGIKKPEERAAVIKYLETLK